MKFASIIRPLPPPEIADISRDIARFVQFSLSGHLTFPSINLSYADWLYRATINTMHRLLWRRSAQTWLCTARVTTEPQHESTDDDSGLFSAVCKKKLEFSHQFRFQVVFFFTSIFFFESEIMDCAKKIYPADCARMRSQSTLSHLTFDIFDSE